MRVQADTELSESDVFHFLCVCVLGNNGRQGRGGLGMFRETDKEKEQK